MNKLTLGISLVALVVGVCVLFGVHINLKNPSFGAAIDCGSTTCFTTLGALTSFQDDGTALFNGVATFASTIVHTGLATFNGGITVTTTNTATSTTSVGCVQTTATSTATPIKLSYATYPNATTTYSGTSSGFVTWTFGSCP